MPRAPASALHVVTRFDGAILDAHLLRRGTLRVGDARYPLARAVDGRWQLRLLPGMRGELLDGDRALPFDTLAGAAPRDLPLPDGARAWVGVGPTTVHL